MLGTHDGAYRFTVGQRRGLGLAGSPEPLFVTAIDGDDVHVGPREALDASVVDAMEVSWIAGAPPSTPRLAAQIRYRSEPLPAELTDLGRGRVRVGFPEQAPRGVAPGQAVVFYDGDECLGGATVTAARGTLAAAADGAG